ncbi:histone deacetylase HDT1-like [Nymphaea colorata]|nr:histone deacetylase HDT1-like [Nymphaea colorata]
MEMEFWGVEVKSGEPLKCDPGEHTYVHLSQVALGEIKKDKPSENVPIYVKVDDKKLAIGTLSTEKCTQVSLDLIFEKEFELSHGWKNGSVYFCGYKSIPEDEEDDDSDSGPEDLIPLLRNQNGEAKPKPVQPKPLTAKPKGKPDLPDSDESDEDADDDEDESDEEDGDEEMQSGDESDEDEDDEDEDSSADEETPEKAGKGKKRPQESATKTPGPEKKAKLVTPDGGKTGATEGKKGGGHVATPYPSKTAGKTPGGDKAKQQTPNAQAKKSGQVICKSCSKTFGSEQGLESHTKAKHSATTK